MTRIRSAARPHASAVVFLLAAVVAAGSLRGGEWALMVEPSFMDHEVRRPVEGSRRTILTVARLEDGGWVPLTREAKRGVDMTFNEVREEAMETAQGVLDNLEPRYVRDGNGVILFAVLESSDPLTASSVLAPGFAERFRDTIGPDLLVAMPDRNRVLVFSRQDTAHVAMGEFIIEGYLSSTWPVSREVFALEGGRLRSLGELR